MRKEVPSALWRVLGEVIDGYGQKEQRKAA